MGSGFLASLGMTPFPGLASCMMYAPMDTYYVYILCSASGTLYIGVTNNLERRICEHKQKWMPGFTRRYDVTRLVHFEVWGTPITAIAREKQIKGWRRSKKLALISAKNPKWEDLSKAWFSTTNVARKQAVIPSEARDPEQTVRHAGMKIPSESPT
jgi:putative endonuclease